MTQTPPNQPLVWLLASPHTGDNTQLMALAEALGWPFVVKRLSYSFGQTIARLVLGGTLIGLTRHAKEQIVRPFPDLIIAAGRPTEAVAHWVKKFGNKDVKLVCLGSPWANLSAFDLVITTPQYCLPKRTNVLHNDLPIHTVRQSKAAEASSAFMATFKNLPRPWTAVFVGGASGPYTFDVAAAKRLAAQSQDFGGSLLITTSARTNPKVTAALRYSVTLPYYFHDWMDKHADNPFVDFLAAADQFVVTADSISMLSESCATGKPVYMFDIEEGPYAMRDQRSRISWLGRNLNSTAFRFAMRVGPPSWSRDLRVVHQQLVSTGRASWLGESRTLPTQPLHSTDLNRSVSRVKALFAL
jgi:uncharacterized protein